MPSRAEPETKRRHCMIVHAHYPAGEVRVERQTRALLQRGFRVDVICLREKDEKRTEHVQGARVFRLPVKRHPQIGRAVQLLEYLSFLALAFIRLQRLSRPENYVTIQVHAPPDFLVLTTLINRLLGSRIILDIHDLMPEFYLGRFGKTRRSWGFRMLKWQEWLATRFSHHVITVTEEWRERLIDRGIAPEKVSVVMNLPDSEVFKTPESVPTNSRFTVFYHGSMQRRYGVDLLIRAVSEIRRSCPGIRLLIHGRGGYLPEFRELAERLGIEAQVTFDTQMVDVSELPALICSADVAVVPYRDDPFTTEILPTKLMEYAALGIPVVAARTRVIARYFDASMVEFFEPGNLGELADRLDKLIRNDDRREELARRIQLFARRYDWKQARHRYTGLIERTGGL